MLLSRTPLPEASELEPDRGYGRNWTGLEPPSDAVLSDVRPELRWLSARRTGFAERHHDRAASRIGSVLPDIDDRLVRPGRLGGGRATAARR